jgi:hypothetical protein
MLVVAKMTGQARRLSRRLRCYPVASNGPYSGQLKNEMRRREKRTIWAGRVLSLGHSKIFCRRRRADTLKSRCLGSVSERITKQIRLRLTMILTHGVG